MARIDSILRLAVLVHKHAYRQHHTHSLVGVVVKDTGFYSIYVHVHPHKHTYRQHHTHSLVGVVVKDAGLHGI